ncbi:MAG TPA: NUDIX domain-containing protein [Candidatus Paceibacterota bacterium]
MTETVEEHFVGKIAQKGIIEHEGKVLITRDSRDATTWELPGGRLNLDERPVDGLARELKEELGVECEIREILYAAQFKHTTSHTATVALIYRVELKKDRGEFNVDPLEIAEMAWVDKDSWENYRLFPEYERALRDYFASL